jgi:uncharacterized protein YraI
MHEKTLAMTVITTIRQRTPDSTPERTPAMTSIDRISDTLSAPTSRRSLLKTLAGAGAAVALAPALGLVSPVAATSTDSRIVNTEGARLRSGPGTGYSIVATLAKGTEVRYLAYGGSANGYVWHKVLVLATGKQGYIAASLLSMPGSGTTTPVITGQALTSSAVNLRSGPGTTYSVLRVVPGGSKIGTSTTVSNGYRYVTHNGLAGWMADAYISFSVGEGPVPTYQTTTANLNLREQPSTTSRILLVIPAGAKVFPNGALNSTFAQVTYNGVTGWVAIAYLK